MKEQLKDIYQPIENDLACMEKILRDSIVNSDHKTISEISQYVLESTGKMLRPSLVLLTARAVHGKNDDFPREKVTKLAAAVELVHLASLVHDDVIDHAHIRHKRPTVNIKWGPEVSIALGDYLYSTAFRLIGECGHIEVMTSVTSAIKEISEGELTQICERDNHQLIKKRYFDIIRKKTACLFSASCHIGALITCASAQQVRNMLEFGLNFGMAYQVIDDLIDLVGEEHSLGKVPRQDLSVGELTLPLLHLLESVTDEEGDAIRKLILSKNIQKTIDELRGLLERSQSLEKTKDTILDYISRAKNSLEVLTDSPYKDALLMLTDLIYYARKEKPHAEIKI